MVLKTARLRAGHNRNINMTTPKNPAAVALGALGGAAGRGKPKPARSAITAARRTANLPKDGREPLPRCPKCTPVRRCAKCVQATKKARKSADAT